MDQIINSLIQFWQYTGFCNATWQNLMMILIGIGFIPLPLSRVGAAAARPYWIRNDYRKIPMFPALHRHL